jgi:hypothetical protein
LGGRLWQIQPKEQGEGKGALLEKKDLDHVPRGKEIHYKVPLSQGGSDTLRNVQLIDKGKHGEIHRKK